jgi:hypothetical protein
MFVTAIDWPNGNDAEAAGLMTTWRMGFDLSRSI